MYVLPIVSFVISTAFPVIAEAYITDMETYEERSKKRSSMAANNYYCRVAITRNWDWIFIQITFRQIKQELSKYKTSHTWATRSGAYYQA